MNIEIILKGPEIDIFIGMTVPIFAENIVVEIRTVERFPVLKHDYTIPIIGKIPMLLINSSN